MCKAGVSGATRHHKSLKAQRKPTICIPRSFASAVGKKKLFWCLEFIKILFVLTPQASVAGGKQAEKKVRIHLPCFASASTSVRWLSVCSERPSGAFSVAGRGKDSGTTANGLSPPAAVGPVVTGSGGTAAASAAAGCGGEAKQCRIVEGDCFCSVAAGEGAWKESHGTTRVKTYKTAAGARA